jgi:hypothetical protein
MTDLYSKTAASNGAVRMATLKVFIAYSRQNVVAIDRLPVALPTRTSRPSSIEGTSRRAKSGGRINAAQGSPKAGCEGG